MSFEFDIMTAPRIFISSTCYDLSYIRDNLEQFIKLLGYIPIRSEKGNVFYKRENDVMTSCINEIRTCQMLILVIGGRYGSEYKESGKSITNHEYNTAIENKIPVFSFVYKTVYTQYEVWLDNKQKNDVKYRSVDSFKIFEFIDEVRNRSYNNAIIPFENFEEIRYYLVQQWANMMNDYLSQRTENVRVNEQISTLKQMNEKIELISKQILKSTATQEDIDITYINLKIMEIIKKFLDGSEKGNVLLSSVLYVAKYNITVKDIINCDNFIEVLKSQNIKLDIKTNKSGEKLYQIESSNSYYTKSGWKLIEEEYSILHNKVMEYIKSTGIKVEDLKKNL